MSDHQFEKNVQQKMDELRLSPSENVWHQVERKIRTQKRRKRGLLWIPLLAVLLTGIFFYYSGIHQSRVEESQISENKKSKPVKQAESSNAPAPEPVTEEKLSTMNADPLAKHPPQVHPSKSTVNDKDFTRSSIKKEKVTTTEKKTSGVAEIRVQPDQIIIRNNLPEEKYIIDKDKQNHPDANLKPDKDKTTGLEERKELSSNETRKEKTPEKITPFLANDAVADSLSNNNDVAKQIRGTELSEILKVDSTLRVSPPIERIRRKWEIGVAVYGGVNKMTSGRFISEKSMLLDAGASSNFSMPVPRNAVIQKPSAIYPGLAMYIRGFARTELRKRLHGSVGVGYGLYQTQIRVGQLVQSNQPFFTSRGLIDVEGYYRAEPNEVYTNGFHFIEVPVEIEYLLNKSKTPVLIRAGATYSRMIGSNALHYDGSSRVYYNDNTVFNKNLAGVTGGLSVGVLQSSKYPLSVGPSFHYRVTNLIHQNIYDRKHLLAAGIDIKMLIRKN